MIRIAARTAIGLLLSALAVPLIGQGAQVSSPVDLARQAESLKPGQWVWAPHIAAAGPVLIYVDLSDQTATVYRNGVRIGVSTVSSGKPGFETPTGVFTILQKDPNHHSSTYNDAPMPFQERLTWGGVALHAGGLPGFPESHGCVHLPLEFSKLLFGITQLGGTVIIAGAAGRPFIGGQGAVLSPTVSGTTQPLTPGQDFVWQPNLAPNGPLTIVISRSDQRVVVLRNGVEIGRSRAQVPNGNFATHVLTYAGVSDGVGKWIYVDVPGQSADAGKPADFTILSRSDMPAQFVAALNAAIAPGTTVLLTEAPVLPTTTGKSLTIMDSNGPRAVR
jgi:hypothetical protein